MRIRFLLFFVLLVAGQLTIAQTTVQLAGACTDCAAVITSLQNCSVASAGTLKAGTPVGAGVTQTIQVVVGKVGKYSFLTSNNGIIFTASGTFTATGTQTVVLTASGYAVSGGVTTFTLTANGQSCAFNRTVDGASIVLSGPCPTNLKFWRMEEGTYGEFFNGGGFVNYGSAFDAFSGYTGSGSVYTSYGNAAISTDSVLYALPYMLKGKQRVDPEILKLTGNAPFEALIVSPTRIQNLPKVVCAASYGSYYISPTWTVGVDGNLYLLISTEQGVGFPGSDPRFPVSGSNFYPYSYVGDVTPYDLTYKVMRYPKPPTGTKWTDISVASAGSSGGNMYALNDLGEMYAIWVDFVNFTTTSYAPDRHMVKLPNPVGTDATFKYTRFHGRGYSRWVAVAGNDGNYYSFGVGFANIHGYSLGWGLTEKTTLAANVDLTTIIPQQNNIRKMAFPAGTVLADDSRHYTVDGQMYAYGQIASGMANNINRGVYFPFPLADGNYRLDRPDMALIQNSWYVCTTPRLVALPPGATRFYGRIYQGVGYIDLTPSGAVGGSLGSSPLIAATDNGVYGIFPNKLGEVNVNNKLAYMEQYTMVDPNDPDNNYSGIYYPKYVASLPSFASYYIPRTQSGLGLDGTLYGVFRSSFTRGIVIGNTIGDIGIGGNINGNPLMTEAYRPKSWPGASYYTLMLNGNCDINNPYPEP